MGDVDGDGKADLAIGAPRADFMGVDSGDPSIRRHLMERPMEDDLIKTAAKRILDA